MLHDLYGFSQKTCLSTEKKQVQDHPEDRLRRAETEGHPDRRLEEDRQVGEVLRTERA